MLESKMSNYASQFNYDKFYINNDIYGITPVPNRMVVFDANIQHRATTFRNDHRFTVAIKYT